MDYHDIIVTSSPKLEYLIAEIQYNNVVWAIVDQEKGYLEITIYPHWLHASNSEEFWTFYLRDVVDILLKARSALNESLSIQEVNNLRQSFTFSDTSAKEQNFLLLSYNKEHFADVWGENDNTMIKFIPAHVAGFRWVLPLGDLLNALLAIYHMN